MLRGKFHYALHLKKMVSADIDISAFESTVFESSLCVRVHQEKYQ